MARKRLRIKRPHHRARYALRQGAGSADLDIGRTLKKKKQKKKEKEVGKREGERSTWSG